MKKFGIVLGVAAVAVIAGCKDPDYRRAGAPAGQNDVKSADTTVAQKPAGKAPAEAAKQCTCAPGTRHTKPCTCGGANCYCIVEQKSAAAATTAPAAATTAPAAATTAPAAGKTEAAGAATSVYVVQSGDYLAKISKRFNVTIAAIKKENNLKSDVVRVGQKLRIPGNVDVGAASAAAASAGPAASKKAAAFTPYSGATKEYVVKSGDTLGAIAYGNGINIRQLKALNGLKSDVVRVGQKLKIPAEKQAAKSVPARKPASVKIATKQAEKQAEKPAADAKPAEAPVAAAESEKPAGDAAAAEPEKPAESASGAAAAEPSTATYVVQEGDDMTGVSIRWGVSAAEIRELNNLGDADQLKPGQILKLPAEAQQ